MNEEWRLVTSSKAYQDYVVFVDSKALEGAARRSIYAKCASSVHTIRSARSSSGLRIPTTSGSCLFSNIHFIVIPWRLFLDPSSNGQRPTFTLA